MASSLPEDTAAPSSPSLQHHGNPQPCSSGNPGTRSPSADSNAPSGAAASSTTAEQLQQHVQNPTSLAVDLETLPAAAGSHLGLGLSFSEVGLVKPASCYGPGTLVFSPVCSVEAAAAEPTLLRGGSSSSCRTLSTSSSSAAGQLLAAALESSTSQQCEKSSSTGQHDTGCTGGTPWSVSGSTMPAPAQLPASAQSAVAAATCHAGLSRSSSLLSDSPAVVVSTSAAKAAEAPADATAAAEAAAAAGDHGCSSSDVLLLVRELGVSMASLLRLFTAGFEAEFEQPVWMVVNLQVRKGSGCAEPQLLVVLSSTTEPALQMVVLWSFSPTLWMLPWEYS